MDGRRPGQDDSASGPESGDTSKRSPIRIPKTAEIVADEIRGMITRGELKEGDSLQPEAKIIADFSVSRPTIREAFRILESEKLISVSRGSRGGARVHAPKAELVARYAGFVLQSRQVSYADVYTARTIIEPPAARFLAEHRAREAPAVLRAKIEEQYAAPAKGTFSRAVADFHTTLIELTGNETLILVSSVLAGIVARHHGIAASSDGQPGSEAAQKRLRAGLKSQARLADLIEAGEAEEAEAHWRRHMENAGKILLSGSTGAAVVSWAD